MNTFPCLCDKHKSSAFVHNLWISLILKLLQFWPIFWTHLVPAFERILPPLHQVALTDPGDAEVNRRARTCTYVHLVQVVHHFPVIGLMKKKDFVFSLKLNDTNNQLTLMEELNQSSDDVQFILPHLQLRKRNIECNNKLNSQKKMGRCNQEEQKINIMHYRGYHSAITCFKFLIEPVLLLREWPGLNVLPGDFSMLLTTDWLLLRGGGHTWGSIVVLGQE